MSFNQFGYSPSATFGTYNDVTGDQTNTTVNGPVNVQNNNFFNQHSNVHEALIRELKGRLNPSNFSGDDRPQCLEDTREQTLQSIYDWVDARGYPNVFLLIGAAGAGKSTVATTVAGKYQRRGQLGCHMFFVRGRSQPGNVLQTIAYSLAFYNQSIAESLVEQLRNSGDIGPSDLKTKFEILLREPLSALATNAGSPVLIVLDALDECGTPETRRSLMNILYDNLSSLPSNCRFLVTARPEADILPFISLSPLSIYTLNLDLRMGENRFGVYMYIRYELEKLKSSKTLIIPQDWQWNEGIQCLANTADGLFIWASTAIKFISETRFGQFRRLKNIVENRNTFDLNELYAAILKNAFEWDSEVKEAFIGVFSFILFSKSSLSDEIISGILGNDTVPDILMYLRSLVVYDPGNPITIRHASFYDYLVSCRGRPWYIDPEAQKVYITSKCLERMEHLLKYNICNIQSSFILNTDVPDIDDRVTQCIPSFLSYICCNWVHYLKDTPYSQELCLQLRPFVYNQLLFWFEILSLTDTFNDHVGPALLSVIKWVGNNDPELSSFLRDAYRQASTYSEPISKSVLQIYTSLLPLTKEDSPMSIHYAKYANSAFRVEYIGRKQRNDCIKTIQVVRNWQHVPISSFSPDSTRILSNSDRGVCVWDATNGELITGLLLAEDDKSYALSAVYLSNGRYIIIASKNGTIRKWNVLTNSLVWERVMSNFQMDSTWGVSVAFSPDRKSVVFGDDEGTIRVWNVDTGEQDGGWLEGHSGYVNFVSFSPDGQYLASGSDDTTIIVWDMEKRGVRTGPLRRHAQRVTTGEFSPSGTNVVSGSEDGTILIWNVFTGEVLHEIVLKGPICSVTYSPNGRFILAGGPEWMSMWNVVDVTGASKVFQVDSKCIQQVSFSLDGSRFVSVSGSPYSFFGNGLIEIWDASWSVEETKSAFEEQGAISSIALSPGGKFIASASHKGSVCLWNGELVKKLKLGYDVNSVAFSPVNEQLIAFGSDDGTVQVWDLTNDEPVTIGNHKSWISSVVFSPSDGKRIASGSGDKTICIWNIERRELTVGPLTGHDSTVWAVAYSPDGTRLVSGSTNAIIHIWNSETGDLLLTLNGHSLSVNSVAYSFDGSYIVSGSTDKTILVWDAQSGQIVCGPINGHESIVRSVCFSPDGKQIISGSFDNTARVWDAITGKPLLPPFAGHTNQVNSVCFFPDGRRFATGSVDGTIRIWTLDTIPNDTNWELRDDNWVVGENGELMIWIPKDLHTHLYRCKNISILGCSFRLKLHFDTK